jgi:hypothetical protein
MSEYTNEPVEPTDEPRDEDTDGGNPADANDLPDEVLVDGPTKLAHEDTVPETEKEAEENETRAGGDFEGAPSAAELREDREEENTED